MPSAPAVATPTVPRMPWDEFVRVFDWRQGEHIGLVGPTGRGKSYLARHLLPLRGWVVVVGTKPADVSLDRIQRDGFRHVRAWPPPHGTKRVLLWPKLRKVEDKEAQARIVGAALRSIFSDRGWTVVLDEAEYVSDDLGLKDDIRLLLKQGRSLHVSVVGLNQRPRWVPREVWTMSTHLFVWGTKDHDDLKALGGLGGLDARTIRDEVARLGKHDCLYVNTRDDQLIVTRAPTGAPK